MKWSDGTTFLGRAGNAGLDDLKLAEHLKDQKQIPSLHTIKYPQKTKLHYVTPASLQKKLRMNLGCTLQLSQPKRIAMADKSSGKRYASSRVSPRQGLWFRVLGSRVGAKT